jgi:hypothetical protein
MLVSRLRRDPAIEARIMMLYIRAKERILIREFYLHCSSVITRKGLG